MPLYSLNKKPHPRRQIGLCLPLWAVVAILFSVSNLIGASSEAQAAESLSRTESNCTIGMAKGDAKAECRVPIPNGCTVAQFPGYPEPWADISKGGGTSCEFDQKQTNWKTSIVGTCQACKTEQCTGRFIVMFNCTDNVPPANPASPQRK